MRPLLRFLRRLFGREEETAAEGTAPPEGLKGRLPEGSVGAVPEFRGEVPRGATALGGPLAGGGTPPGASAGAAVFSGAEVRGTAEGAAGYSGGRSPGRGAAFEAQEEVLTLGGPPEDRARALSELLRFQRRMGSTVGEFGEEVL